jgi:hypothetical protein
MPVELVIAPEAELDIAEAYVWYESHRAGLGEEFLSSVDACSGKHPAPTRDVLCRSRGLPSLPYTALSLRRVLRTVEGDGHDLRCISHLSRPGQMAPAPALMRFLSQMMWSGHIRTDRGPLFGEACVAGSSVSRRLPRPNGSVRKRIIDNLTITAGPGGSSWRGADRSAFCPRNQDLAGRGGLARGRRRPRHLP